LIGSRAIYEEALVVAKFSLRRYDTQAQVGLILAILAVLSLLGFAFLILTSNVDWSAKVISFGPRRRIAMLGAAAVTMALGAGAFGFGYNSASQRRNDRQGMSWMAFFIGALAMSLCLILFLFMRLRGELVLPFTGA
jgi:hypothetical protein